MTDTPTGGPTWPQLSRPMTAEEQAIVAANRHVEGRKGGGVPPEVAEFLKGAEGNDAEIARRLRLIGATPTKARQAAPPAAPEGGGDKSPVSPAEIAAKITQPLW